MTTIGHGTRTRYNKGCRCDLCVHANRTYKRAWMAEWRAAHPVIPDTYVDPVAVERACKGDRTVNLTSEEVAAAVAHLHGRGLNFIQTAKTLGLSDRTVFRIVRGVTAVPCSRPGRAA